MDKNGITNNIAEFLNMRSEFTQKNEVVYFLSEIRKVIENSKKYSNLKFYCNWVLHSKLTRESTIKILSSKLDKFVDFSKNKSEIQEMIRKADEGRFIKMEDFKSELKGFLNDYKLPDIFDDRGWYKLRRLYLEIIYKCPISQESSGISGLYLSKEKDGYYYGFYVNKIVRIPRIKLKL
jgi:hypothetical protein